MGITCASCGYDNDPTRVYCHSCGQKIERGGAAPPPPTGFAHPTDAVKMKLPRAAIPWGKYFAFLLKVVVLAALVAAVVLGLMRPDHVPAPVDGDDNLAQRLAGLVSDASAADSARAFAVPTADLQRWLASVVRLQGSTGVLALDPRRIYLVTSDDGLRLGLELELPAATSVFMEGRYVLVRNDSGYTLQPVAYSIGKLPLPVPLGYLVERQFEGVRDALAQPLGQLAQASFIGIGPESVSLRWSGSKSP